MKKTIISRRSFIGKTAAAAALAAIPFNYPFAKGSGSKKPNSKVGGVQLGLTTYCYRSIPHSLEETLQYVLQSGVNSLEMRSVLEEGLGIPQPERQTRTVSLTDQEKDEQVKAAKVLREAQRKWRLSLPVEKYEEVRKMYNKAAKALGAALQRKNVLCIMYYVLCIMYYVLCIIDDVRVIHGHEL